MLAFFVALLGSVHLVPIDTIMVEKQRTLFFEALQVGGLAVMSVFFLIYFLSRRQDYIALSFAILCLVAFIFIISSGEVTPDFLLPELTLSVLTDLSYVTFFMTLFLNFIFISTLFPEGIPHWVVLLVKITGIVIIVSIILLPMHLYTYSLPVFHVYVILLTIYLMVRLFQHKPDSKPGLMLVGLGLIILLSVILNHMGNTMGWVYENNFIGWGLLLYLILLMVVTSRRFSKGLTHEEKLLEELTRANERLAYNLEDKSREIEKQSIIINEQRQRILEKNEALVRAREEEKILMKTIVHDLKSPFNRILGLISIFKMEKVKHQASNEEMEKIFQMVETVAKEGNSLIEDLNVLTLFDETLEGEDKYQETDLIHLLKDLILGHQGYAAKKGIAIHFHSQAQKYIIETHQPSLTRIIDNLLSNAIKFSPRSTTVYVECKPHHDRYEIFIRDEGPGFTEADRMRIFEKFKKLSARPTQGESSTGLGLNIVKTLTEGLSGRVKLLPNEPGAHFVLEFPRRPGSQKTEL